MSEEKREPLECNTSCWKYQRDRKLANAFGSSKDFEENKEGIQIEYYPEDSLEFAQANPKFVKKIENQLTDIVLKQSSRSFSNLSSAKRFFLMMYVFEHFKLDMCTYGGKKTQGHNFTDVYWKEGSRVPEILASEVVDLINRGIMSATAEEQRNSIFEASIEIINIPKGSSTEDIKKLLQNFSNEYYAERRGGTHAQPRSVMLHFYKLMRAQDAVTFLRNSAHQFPDFEMVSHRKQIGTNADSTPAEEQKESGG